MRGGQVRPGQSSYKAREEKGKRRRPAHSRLPTTWVPLTAGSHRRRGVAAGPTEESSSCTENRVTTALSRLRHPTKRRPGLIGGCKEHCGPLLSTSWCGRAGPPCRWRWRASWHAVAWRHHVLARRAQSWRISPSSRTARQSRAQNADRDQQRGAKKVYSEKVVDEKMHGQRKGSEGRARHRFILSARQV